jgi:hypothetical protein
MECWFSEWCSYVTRSLFRHIFSETGPFVALIPQGRFVADKIQLRDLDEQNKQQDQIAELWISSSSTAALKQSLSTLTKKFVPIPYTEDFIENVVELWIIYKTCLLSTYIDEEILLKFINSSCINWDMVLDLLTDWPILSPIERSSLRVTLSKEIRNIRNTLLQQGSTKQK